MVKLLNFMVEYTHQDLNHQLGIVAFFSVFALTKSKNYWRYSFSDMPLDNKASQNILIHSLVDAHNSKVVYMYL